MEQKIVQIRAEIVQSLQDNAESKTIEERERFFKEQIKTYGVTVPTVSKIGKNAFGKLDSWSKAEIFALCDELWKSGYLEEEFIAADLSYYIHKQYEPTDFVVFENWVNNYLSNWAACDTLCNHTVGEFVEMFPEYVSQLKRWAMSENRWVKRAAAVSLIVPARKGLFLDEILEIATTLLLDKDDLVQKGYGWMLKAASMSESSAAAKKSDPAIRKEHLEAVFNFVMQNKAVMPRTSLRYAIEKMPQELRVKAMEK